LLLTVSDERDGAAGSSGSNCGGGAGNGPGVSCALASPGAAKVPAANMQIKPTAMLTLLFIIILVAHIIVPYFSMPKIPRKMQAWRLLGSGSD
jgi:hypothetical protein